MAIFKISENRSTLVQKDEDLFVEFGESPMVIEMESTINYYQVINYLDGHSVLSFHSWAK